VGVIRVKRLLSGSKVSHGNMTKEHFRADPDWLVAAEKVT